MSTNLYFLCKCCLWNWYISWIMQVLIWITHTTIHISSTYLFYFSYSPNSFMQYKEFSMYIILGILYSARLLLLHYYYVTAIKVISSICWVLENILYYYYYYYYVTILCCCIVLLYLCRWLHPQWILTYSYRWMTLQCLYILHSYHTCLMVRHTHWHLQTVRLTSNIHQSSPKLSYKFSHEKCYL